MSPMARSRRVSAYNNAPRAVRVKAEALDAGEHRITIDDCRLSRPHFAERSETHCSGALARVKAALRSVGASRP
jgi:hypothetical protein